MTQPIFLKKQIELLERKNTVTQIIGCIVFNSILSIMLIKCKVELKKLPRVKHREKKIGDLDKVVRSHEKVSHGFNQGLKE